MLRPLFVRPGLLLLLAAMTLAACADRHAYAPYYPPYYPPAGPPPPSAPSRYKVTPPPPPIDVIRPKVR